MYLYELCGNVELIDDDRRFCVGCGAPVDRANEPTRDVPVWGVWIMRKYTEERGGAHA